VCVSGARVTYLGCIAVKTLLVLWQLQNVVSHAEERSRTKHGHAQ